MRRTLWTLPVSQVGTIRASIDEQGRYFYGLRASAAEVTGWQAVVGALVDHPALFPGPTAAEVQAADRATTYGRWFDHASGNDPRETYSLLAFPRGGWGLEVLGDRVMASFNAAGHLTFADVNHWVSRCPSDRVRLLDDLVARDPEAVRALVQGLVGAAKKAH